MAGQGSSRQGCNYCEKQAIQQVARMYKHEVGLTLLLSARSSTRFHLPVAVYFVSLCFVLPEGAGLPDVHSATAEAHNFPCCPQGGETARRDLEGPGEASWPSREHPHPRLSPHAHCHRAEAPHSRRSHDPGSKHSTHSPAWQWVPNNILLKDTGIKQNFPHAVTRCSSVIHLPPKCFSNMLRVKDHQLLESQFFI